MTDHSRIGPAFLTCAALSAVACLLAVSGCGTKERPSAAAAGSPTAGPASPLAGTSWRLVELQSMDNAQGITRPDDPSVFTLRLNADGSVALRLDCNRVTGTWSATPGADAASGQFSFGPLAATLAACAPPDLGATLAAQAQYVRSYLLKDGRLSLSLMADGGIWIWEPDSIPPRTAAHDTALEQAILAATPSYTRATLAASGPADTARYALGRVDLNGDGREEVFVYPMGSVFCGTGGCTLMLFTSTAEGYRLVKAVPTSRPPVVVLDRRSQGWHDFVRLQSGGGAPSAYVRHRYDGSRYVEAGRQPADSVPPGRQVLSTEIDYRSGISLVPRD
jgi:heat shock protein HslJ